MAAHAKYSPSDSARWLACEGAIAFCDTLPVIEVEEDTDSPSAQGTRAHELAEKCINTGKPPETYTTDTEMVRHIAGYIRFVEDQCVGASRVVVEERLDMTHLIPDMFGTADVVVYDEVNRHIKVIDLKYGQGVAVTATWNTQLLLYAVGAVYNCAFPVDTIELSIYQPRVFDGLPAARVWEISRKDLRKFEKTVIDSYSRQDSGVLTPGEKQCRWCAAAPVCPALKNMALEKAAAEFEPFATKNAADMNHDDLVDSLQHVNMIKFWCNAVEAKAQELLEHGHTLPGFKLVRGRSNRKWVDEEKAIETLINMGIDRNKLYSEKFLSPTQAEKVMEKEEYIALAPTLVFKPEGKMTIAKADDPRPSIDPFQAFKDNE